MAVNDVPISASAAELEAAAKAEHWTKVQISNLVYPSGCVIFFSEEISLTDLNTQFGTSYKWEKWGQITMDNGYTLYGYRKM